MVGAPSARETMPHATASRTAARVSPAPPAPAWKRARLFPGSEYFADPLGEPG
jgi:hypothetical protein